jgi:hypothetical protein
MLAALVYHRVKSGATAETDRLTGFLYDSFREGAPAWEALRPYRKALLCAVLMIDGLVLQAMTAMALITTSVVLTAMFSPFRSWLVNALDILGQLVLVYVLSMSAALFFSGNVNSSLQQSMGAVLASLIIFVVLSFIAAILVVTICKKRKEESIVSPSKEGVVVSEDELHPEKSRTASDVYLLEEADNGSIESGVQLATAGSRALPNTTSKASAMLDARLTNQNKMNGMPSAIILDSDSDGAFDD